MEEKECDPSKIAELQKEIEEVKQRMLALVPRAKKNEEATRCVRERNGDFKTGKVE